MKKQVTYVALTTTNAQYGFEIIAAGHNKATVKDKADEIIGAGISRFAETECKNLMVMSATKAKRFGWATFIPSEDSRYVWVK